MAFAALGACAGQLQPPPWAPPVSRNAGNPYTRPSAGSAGERVMGLGPLAKRCLRIGAVGQQRQALRGGRQRPWFKVRVQAGEGTVGGAVAKDESASAATAEAALAVADLDADAVQDLTDVQDIIETMELLKKKRQMSVPEVRLVLMIEDPREAEKRRQLGVESDSGCSREELAAAFMEVMEDRVPGDRLALRTLAQEMRNWPLLREEEDPSSQGPSQGQRKSLYAQVTDVGLPGGRRNTPLPPSAAASDWDAAADAAVAAAAAAKEQEKDLGETLPPWVGYGVLYGVTSIPLLIGVVVIVILFLNSLQ